MKNILAVILILAPLVLAQEKAEVKSDPNLPEGAGKKVVEKICTKCHDSEGFSHSRNSRSRWETIVDEMISRGAEASDAEAELIVNYLATYLGKLNLNKATAGKISEDLKISNELGAAIVAYREKNGPFKLWEDLASVPGIDLKKIQDKKGIVEF
jgi:competence ComEA-like helix-hairpin-helix protein